MRSFSRVIGPAESKRFAMFSVALCLALAGIGVGLIAARDHRDKVVDSGIGNDALQREEAVSLRDLGTEASPSAAVPSMPTAVPQAALTIGIMANGTPLQGQGAGIQLSQTPNYTPAQSAAPVAVGGNGGSAGGPGASGAPSVGGTAGMQANPSDIPAQAAPNEKTAPGGQALPASETAAAQASTPAYGYSQQSVICGPNTCNLGQICCNASCGTCAAPGATCDQTRCDNAITYPSSQACGMSTCNIDTVCCNPSCGTCVAPGAQCSQAPCT